MVIHSGPLASDQVRDRMHRERLNRRAERLLWLHPLRSADAEQLAAALLACREAPEQCAFHCADRRLLQAAEKEGFLVRPPMSA